MAGVSYLDATCMYLGNPEGFQDSVHGISAYAARWYSLMRPPRTG